MPSILIAGSGKIGSAIGRILAQPGTGYSVILADLHTPRLNPEPQDAALNHISLDVQNRQHLAATVKEYEIQAIVSCLPYFLTQSIAELASILKLHYFDLTEDVETTAAIAEIAKHADTAFVPQCGVAPGFINIVAHNLMQNFTELDTVKLQCGALPQQASNALQYALTWSVDGLINEYGNPCAAIVDQQLALLNPLTDLENVNLDGAIYEAFNTSGGIGTLLEKYINKVNNLNYKTLRYPGHCKKMRFLMQDLKLNADRNLLKKILSNALPHSHQDVVITHVCVQGQRHGKLMQENYLRKFYPQTIHHHRLSAIQITTASSACAIIDLVLQNPQKYRGFIHQADFSLTEFLNNRFGRYLKE